MVAIINYGLGNLGSIANMLKVIGEKSVITADPEKIKAADKIILPGVGAFDAGMGKLNETGLVDLIKEEARNGKPILGICLGMQLLGNGSEEGQLPGLGLIDFKNILASASENGEPLLGPATLIDVYVQHVLVQNVFTGLLDCNRIMI